MYISIYSDVQALIYCTIDTSSFSLFSDMGLRSFSSLFSMGKINALRSRMDLLRQIVYAQKDDFVIENHENRNVLLMPQKIAITFETILNILKKAYLKSRFNYLSLSIATWKLAFMAFVKEDLLNSACGRWFCFYWPEVVKKPNPEITTEIFHISLHICIENSILIVWLGSEWAEVSYNLRQRSHSFAPSENAVTITIIELIKIWPRRLSPRLCKTY